MSVALVVGCEDVTRMPTATADVECLVASSTSVGINGGEIDHVTDREVGNQVRCCDGTVL